MTLSGCRRSHTFYCLSDLLLSTSATCTFILRYIDRLWIKGLDVELCWTEDAGMLDYGRQTSLFRQAVVDDQHITTGKLESGVGGAAVDVSDQSATNAATASLLHSNASATQAMFVSHSLVRSRIQHCVKLNGFANNDGLAETRSGTSQQCRLLSL